MLLTLSDELLLFIVQELGPRNLSGWRATNKKLRLLAPFEDVLIVLPEDEEYFQKDKKRDTLYRPPKLHEMKHLTIANQAKDSDGMFYKGVICPASSYRIMRWEFLYETSEVMNAFLKESPLMRERGYYFDDDPITHTNTLVSFTWSHASPITMENLATVMKRHSKTLRHLEISMIAPPGLDDIQYFEDEVAGVPKLESLIYRGLSHTEPCQMNGPPVEGRFRMIRPIFQLTHSTLKKLVLTQEHCISQVGKTPLINGRTQHSFLCNPDELLVNPKTNAHGVKPVTLNLSELELGGFDITKMMNLDAEFKPKVQIEVNLLRRLVLKECNGMAPFLRALTLRKSEIQLKEIGFEVVRDSNALEDFGQFVEALLDFMSCFNGLELFSLLWSGDQVQMGVDGESKMMKHHIETLKAWSILVRSIDANHETGFNSVPQQTNVWTELLDGSSTPPRLTEIALHLDSISMQATYPHPQLRLLSQIPSLKTVHVRNFPSIPRLDGEFWRRPDGLVNVSAYRCVAELAEQIALPFHSMEHITGIVEKKGEGMDDGVVTRPPVAQNLYDNLTRVMEKHNTNRDQKLRLNGAKLRSFYQSSTPRRDITPQIIQQRADSDYHFSNIVRKIRDGTADGYDKRQYQHYESTVKETLGYRRSSEKPELSLIVIGDWRYRDQLNLTGPRTWDPNSWCEQKKKIFDKDDEDEDMDMDDDEDFDEDGDLIYNYNYGDTKYRLREDFEKQYDVSLMPIFYRIDWKCDAGEDTKYRWRATATPIPDEDAVLWGDMPNTKLLHFAFQK